MGLWAGAKLIEIRLKKRREKSHLFRQELVFPSNGKVEIEY
jgi:hypothetical protein